MLIWRYTIPAIEVEVVSYQYLTDGTPTWFGAEVTILPPNPALQLMLICRQTATELLSVPVHLIAHVKSTDYRWWLYKTTKQYKQHFNTIKVRFECKVANSANLAALEILQSDFDIKSDFERFWEDTNILIPSAWTLSEKAEDSIIIYYTAEATVELRVSEAIETETDKVSETSSLNYMDATGD